MPGDIWKARFSGMQSPAGAAVTYERKLKSPEGRHADQADERRA